MKLHKDANRYAFLVLQDGTVFEGISIGVRGTAVGELIFNTANVGYQETLTDPSYAGQLVVFTSPHIGNVGCNFEDEESSRFWPSGLILREKPTTSTYWRSEINLQTYLEKHQVVGIAEIDTRKLTRLLRNKGNLSATIISARQDIGNAQKLALDFDEVYQASLLEKVTAKIPYSWSNSATRPHVLVYDFGVKRNILRTLTHYGVKVTVVPAKTSATELKKMQPDGIILSNGPGNPLAFTEVIDIIKALIQTNIPILGICLGHQLLGIALGGRIEKLKFGHHGINHPIKEIKTDRIFISSQNHNFVLIEQDLPQEIEITHRSLFDDSIQGIQHKNKFIFGIQGHPEGCPGPTDLVFLFNSFVQAAVSYCQGKN